MKTLKNLLALLCALGLLAATAGCEQGSDVDYPTRDQNSSTNRGEMNRGTDNNQGTTNEVQDADQNSPINPN